MQKWGGFWALCASFIVAASACDRDATAEAPVELPQAAEPGAESGRAEAAARVDQEVLLIGQFALPENPIIDGDTIRVVGLDSSVRLLSIDTEEKFRGKADRAAAAKDFDQYLASKRGDAKRPRKTGTPLGEEATEFAKAFFKGAESVRLERDSPTSIRGSYGRPLAYAFVKKNGRWTSYNIECVRAGMSPYFTKYGYSRRFHNEFTHAEKEARQAQRGIWSPDAQGYGDYSERKAWWNARAEFIRAFEHEASQRDDLILLTRSDAPELLEENLGQQVTVLSTVARIKHFKGLVRVSLMAEGGNRFPIIFFDRDLFRKSDVAGFSGEPISVRGKVERYEKGSYRTLQIVVEEAGQVTLPELPDPGKQQNDSN